MTNSNPWHEIPLEDYERHMSHELVGQSTLLSALTKKYLENIKPGSAIFLGVAGGNGLEHIDNRITKTVIGIDINQNYLDTTFSRYNERIASLQLINLDIAKNSERVYESDFIWAALIAEYSGIDPVLEFSRNNISSGGHFILSIQSNNNKPSVSSTGIESVKKAGQIFSPISPEELLRKSGESGFIMIGKEENRLPNEKSIITFHFIV
jgi:predicted TPR repeat methyltransferase